MSLKLPAWIEERLPIRIAISERVSLAQRMSFLLSAGVPLVESITLLRPSYLRTPRKLKIVDTVIADVSTGKTLSQTLADLPGLFGVFTINLLRVGESTGTLAQNLQYIAEELAKRERLKRKVVGALIYPAVVTAAACTLTLFLLTYLFPKIVPLFVGLHIDLPLATKIVLALSGIVLYHGLGLLVIFLTLIFASRMFYRRSSRWRYFLASVLLRLPLFGRLFCEYNTAQGTRTLGLLLTGNMPIAQALELTAVTSVNPLYAELWGAAGRAVDGGSDLAPYLQTSARLFPDLTLDLIAVSERTGKLAETLLSVALYSEHELDELTKQLTSLLEPVLMIILGLGVGLIAMAIITPLYTITQHV